MHSPLIRHTTEPQIKELSVKRLGKCIPARAYAHICQEPGAAVQQHAPSCWDPYVGRGGRCTEEMCWTSHFYHCHEMLNMLSGATHLLSVGLHLPDPLPARSSAKQKVKAEHWDNQSAPNLLMGFSSYNLLVFISFIRIPPKKKALL